MQLEALVVGRVFCDITMMGAALPAPGTETFATGFGISAGGAATRAVAAARLGVRTGLVSAVGADALGGMVIDQLEGESGLDLSLVVRCADLPTSVTVACVADEDRSMITHEASGIRSAALAEPAAHPFEGAGSVPGAGPQVVQVSINDEVPGWVATLRRSGAVVVADLGWDDDAAWPAVARRLAGVDAVVLNERESRALTGLTDPLAAADRLAEQVGTIFLTRAADGVVAMGSSGRVIQAAPPVEVMDPTGAGDVFSAGVIAGLVGGLDLDDTVSLAVAASSWSVAHSGGASGAPRRSDLDPALRLRRD